MFISFNYTMKKTPSLKWVLLNPPTTDQPTTYPPTKRPPVHRPSNHRPNDKIIFKRLDD